MKALLALFTALALSAVPAVAQVDPHRLSEHIRILASDEFEGRGPGTPGEEKSVAYIEAQYKALGLAPAGDNGGWTQAVPLRRFETPGEIHTAFVVNGARHDLVELDDIVVHTLLPVDHVAIASAPLVFIGYGVSAPERGWDDFKGYDLKGKIAVVLINDPDFEAQPGDDAFGKFGGKAMTYYGRWTYKYAEAAKRGALGVLIVHETAPAAYGWATVRNSNSNAQFDIVRDRPGDLHPLVEGWIQRGTAESLFTAAGLDFQALKVKARSAGFRPVELTGARFAADYKVVTATVVSHNVIARIKGSTRPAEAVLFGAHWDHLGVGVPDARGDRIYNGAMDNAAGVAGMLELARRFAQDPKPQRSIYFIAFTAEEKGLLGSEYFGLHPVAPLAKTAALLNLDGLNLAGPARDLETQGDGGSTLEAALAAELARQGRRFTPDQHLELGHFFRADHFSLAKVGVPAITLQGGLDLVKGGIAAGEAARADYVAHRYHQPADEWRADWDLTGAAQDLEAYYALGRRLADSRVWPGWRDGSEFKAARDASAATRR